MEVDGIRIVKNVLAHVKDKLNKMTSQQLRGTAKQINISYIFDCINYSRDILILEECFPMLHILLLALPPQIAFNKYAANIVQTLSHPENIVKTTLIELVDTLVATNNNFDLQSDLVFALLDCLSSTNESLVARANLCLMRFKSKQILQSSLILSKLRIMTGPNSEVRPRLGIYSILIHWSKKRDVLEIIIAKRLFSSLTSDIVNRNSSTRIKVIKALKNLAKTEHGFDFLNSIGIIKDLYNSLSTQQQYPGTLINVFPTVLEFFRDTALVKPQLILESYPQFFIIIFKILNEKKNLLVDDAIEAIDKLATSWDCKIALDIPAPKMLIDECKGKSKLDIWSIFIEKLSIIACGATIKNREMALKAIAKIISVESTDVSSLISMTNRTQKWYKQLTNNPFKNIVYRACSVPVLKIQTAGFQILLKLSEQPWGLEEINKYPSIMDLVLIPPHDDEATALEMLRKKIVETIFKSKTSRVILDKAILLRVHSFYHTQRNRGTIINLSDFRNFSV